MKLGFICKVTVKEILLYFKSLKFKGTNFHCPVCGFNAARFGNSHHDSRPNVRCPRCDSLERHRAQWLYGIAKTNYSANPEFAILHFAPEFCYARIFMRKVKEYATADYSKKMYADFCIDIQNTRLESEKYDLIICNHVLEHVKNDHAALAELHRLLKVNGTALIQVPVDNKLENTYEDPTVIDPGERKKHYLQFDHVRLYGRDFAERLKKVGFAVEVIKVWEVLSQAELNRYSLHDDEPVFVCKKQGISKSRLIDLAFAALIVTAFRI